MKLSWKIFAYMEKIFICISKILRFIFNIKILIFNEKLAAFLAFYFMGQLLVPQDKKKDWIHLMKMPLSLWKVMKKIFLLKNTLCMKKILENIIEDENFYWSWFFGDFSENFYKSFALINANWTSNIAVKTIAPLNGQLKVSIAPGWWYSWILRTKNGPYKNEIDKLHFTDESFALCFHLCTNFWILYG